MSPRELVATLVFIASIPGLAIALGIWAICYVPALRKYFCTALVFAAAKRLAKDVDPNETIADALGLSDDDGADDVSNARKERIAS